jgi:tetraacyldisaccharide-1-P 4'-kinase
MCINSMRQQCRRINSTMRDYEMDFLKKEEKCDIIIEEKINALYNHPIDLGNTIKNKIKKSVEKYINNNATKLLGLSLKEKYGIINVAKLSSKVDELNYKVEGLTKCCGFIDTYSYNDAQFAEIIRKKLIETINNSKKEERDHTRFTRNGIKDLCKKIINYDSKGIETTFVDVVEIGLDDLIKNIMTLDKITIDKKNEIKKLFEENIEPYSSSFTDDEIYTSYD